MKLEEAQAYAGKVVETIRDMCERIEVVGSIRRRKREVNDIDVVLIPKFGTWPSIVPHLKKALNMVVIREGPELLGLGFSEADLPVDIYKATPENWGVLLLIRTGSKEHNIKLCTRARWKGMMLSAAKGVIKDGKVIASRTEEEIFKALGMSFVEPEKREA